MGDCVDDCVDDFVDDFVDDSEGVDIEKRMDRPEYHCLVLGCLSTELIWLVALLERGIQTMYL